MLFANIFLALSFIVASGTSLFSETNPSTDIDQELHGKMIRWITSSDTIANMSQLIPAGIDHRLLINNTLVPGKTLWKGNHFLMYYAYKSEEYMTSNFGLLVVIMNATTWIWVKYDEKPLGRHAILGGLDPETTKTLYVCRGTHESLVFTGSLLKDSGTCIPFIDGEGRLNEYEVLVLVINPYGEYLGLTNSERICFLH